MEEGDPSWLRCKNYAAAVVGYADMMMMMNSICRLRWGYQCS